MLTNVSSSSDDSAWCTLRQTFCQTHCKRKRCSRPRYELSQSKFIEEGPVHDEKQARDFGKFLNAIIVPNPTFSLNAMTNNDIEMDTRNKVCARGNYIAVLLEYDVFYI